MGEPDVGQKGDIVMRWIKIQLRRYALAGDKAEIAACMVLEPGLIPIVGDQPADGAPKFAVGQEYTVAAKPSRILRRLPLFDDAQGGDIKRPLTVETHTTLRLVAWGGETEIGLIGLMNADLGSTLSADLGLTFRIA
jgi:hypothetical protein